MSCTFFLNLASSVSLSKLTVERTILAQLVFSTSCHVQPQLAKIFLYNNFFFSIFCPVWEENILNNHMDSLLTLETMFSLKINQDI